MTHGYTHSLPPCCRQVFRSLSALSWSPAAAKFNIIGFPKKEKKLEKRLESEEELYVVLKNLFNARPGEVDPADAGSRTTTGEGEYEDIYQAVVSPNKIKKPLIATRASKREYPIREFVETETHYLGKYC